MARYDLELDLTEVAPPANLLRARKALEGMSAGQTLHVVTGNVDSVKDFDSLAGQTGDTLVGKQTVRDRLHLVFRKN